MLLECRSNHGVSFLCLNPLELPFYSESESQSVRSGSPCLLTSPSSPPLAHSVPPTQVPECSSKIQDTVGFALAVSSAWNTFHQRASLTSSGLCSNITFPWRPFQHLLTKPPASSCFSLTEVFLTTSIITYLRIHFVYWLPPPTECNHRSKDSCMLTSTSQGPEQCQPEGARNK